MSGINEWTDEQCCLEGLLNHIHQNCGSIVTVEDLRKEWGISKKDFTRLFCQYLNTTPTEYICQYRLEKACRLLIQTNKPVAEISRECGMTNSYLSKRVREETGLTPLEYRRAYYRNQAEKE